MKPEKNPASSRLPAVAFQGELGAYSELAAIRLGRATPCKSFDAVFESVVGGRSRFGVLPVENSLGGSIHQNYDLLLRHRVRIVAETFVSIDHCLMGVKGASVQRATEVLSHPQALAQCQKFFAAHAHLNAVAAYDTAGSAKMVAASQHISQLAIASRQAAARYGLRVLKEHIADEKENVTRFVVIAKPSPARLPIPAVLRAKKKTSVVFTLKNEPGSLFNALAAFTLRKIDLTKIESRPLKRKAFDYIFYLDFTGDEQELNVQHALRHLSEQTVMQHVLGSYGEIA
ncbi:MAG: prephenate dehydratase [Rhizobacter sp.]|nr:prephenate dehydratase [Chlorobiales bacterium]